jgi:hypothetical protein
MDLHSCGRYQLSLCCWACWVPFVFPYPRRIEHGFLSEHGRPVTVKCAAPTASLTFRYSRLQLPDPVVDPHTQRLRSCRQQVSLSPSGVFVCSTPPIVSSESNNISPLSRNLSQRNRASRQLTGQPAVLSRWKVCPPSTQTMVRRFYMTFTSRLEQANVLVSVRDATYIH